MLVLTRKYGQSIDCIYKDITIKITLLSKDKQKGGNQVMIGFDAPDEVTFIRDDANIKFRKPLGERGEINEIA